MVAKSVLDVDVKDDAFKRFAALYDKYQKAVVDTEKQWEKIGKTTGRTAQIFAQMAKHLTDVKDLSEDLHEEQKRGATLWERLAGASRKFAGHIKESTASLARWTSGKGAAALGEAGGLLEALGPAGAVLGILAGVGVGTYMAGTGKLFGMKERADTVMGRRLTALGLGSPIGEMQAFNLNYAPLLGDPAGFLSAVATMRGDPRTSWMLGQLGVSQKEQSGDTVQVGDALLKHVKSLVDRTSDQNLGLLLSQYPGLSDLGFGVEQLRALKGVSLKELAERSRAVGTDQRSLGLNADVAKKWADAAVSFERTAQVFDTAVTKSLTPTLPAFVLAGQVTQGAATTFADAVAAFVKGVEGMTGKPILTGGGINLPGTGIHLGASGHPGDIDWSFFTGGRSGEAASLARGATRAAQTLHGLGLWNTMFQGIDMTAIAAEESGGRQNALGPMTKYGRAQGMFQLMMSQNPQLTRAGIDPMNPVSALRGAEMVLADNLRHYHGDILKAIAAYNWNTKALDADIRRHHGDWQKFLPSETMNYLRKYAMLIASSHKQVTIHNNTGGNTVVSAQQASGSQ